MDRRPLIIAHNDADGWCAAAIAHAHEDFAAEIRHVQYHDAEPTDEDVAGRVVYVLDFSFPPEAMERIFIHAKRLVWIDHHGTAIRDTQARWPGAFDISADIVLQEGPSGALLTWQHLNPDEPVPDAVALVDDHDTWAHADARTDAFIEGLGAASRQGGAAEHWLQLLGPKMGAELAIDELRTLGEPIVAARAQRIERDLAAAAPLILDGHKARAAQVTRSSDINWLAHALHQEDDVEIGWVWRVVVCPEGQVLVKNSIRCASDSVLDLGAVARMHGGGGHRSAAGWTEPIEEALVLLTMADALRTADDWQGMYDVAARRADKAEGELSEERELHRKTQEAAAQAAVAMATEINAQRERAEALAKANAALEEQIGDLRALLPDAPVPGDGSLWLARCAGEWLLVQAYTHKGEVQCRELYWSGTLKPCGPFAPSDYEGAWVRLGLHLGPNVDERIVALAEAGGDDLADTDPDELLEELRGCDCGACDNCVDIPNEARCDPDEPSGPAEPELYLIQDTRGGFGDWACWWGHDGAGYRSVLDEAGRYTLQEAQRRTSRPTDVFWPESLVLQVASTAVFNSALRKVEDQRAALLDAARGAQS